MTKKMNRIYGDLKRGDRIVCYDRETREEQWRGTVYEIVDELAHVKRDDGRTGGGRYLNGYGSLYLVEKLNYRGKMSWCGNDEYEYIEFEKIVSWKKKLTGKVFKKVK